MLAEHHRLIREAFHRRGGVEVHTQGDAFLVVFSQAAAGVRAAADAQRALAAHTWPDGSTVRVRKGLHTSEPAHAGGTYVGLDVHRAMLLCSAGHGGQVLLSLATRELVHTGLPSDLSLRDCGEHRLKDLHGQEQVFQLVIRDLPSDFPTLRTLTARLNYLPQQVTPFVGRERKLAAARERLLRTDVRLLTLIGPGGTGKTRLGLRLAADVLEHFADGVYFVPLAAISDPALVVSTVALALGVRESAGRELLKRSRTTCGRSRSWCFSIILSRSCKHRYGLPNSSRCARG